MDLREVGYDFRDWINLVQNRDRCRAYVRTAMNLRVLKSLKWAKQVTSMGFGEMRPKIRHRLHDIRLTVGENLEKIQPGNQLKQESNSRPIATPDRQAIASADRSTPVAT
ncbi:hypothetical protein ANN_00958 [Periplaneta americana]|uniref:Uncharacterized protein n=1 Tax=Periplaneta americana TaxID=6978 RepID=A0ABQ8TTX5_PERAM|nr:hypothetical protein ANN_00958 [Periplaneta americana]